MKEGDLNPLVRYRLERARSALRDAESLLLCDGSPEGVINRAYYAMFYSVLALFQHLEKVPRKHSGVISLFDHDFYKAGIFPKELSKDLHRAFELRQKSDYQDLVTIEWDTARSSSDSYRAFLVALPFLRVLQIICPQGIVLLQPSFLQLGPRE